MDSCLRLLIGWLRDQEKVWVCGQYDTRFSHLNWGWLVIKLQHMFWPMLGMMFGWEITEATATQGVTFTWIPQNMTFGFLGRYFFFTFRSIILIGWYMSLS